MTRALKTTTAPETMPPGLVAAADVASGKGHHDENFPVASRLIHPRYRQPILAYYRFARAADDVVDHPTLSAAEKFALLDRLEQTLLGTWAGDPDVDALPLRHALAARGLSPRHAQDLLVAFRRDVTKQRYDDWADLMDYCRYSAMPVGRFVLEVHGETEATWPASDALCAALQVINHLQDCGKDYHALGRVYLPLDALAAVGLTPEVLASPAPAQMAAFQDCVRNLAGRSGDLLRQSHSLSSLINDFRLSLEVSVIQRLAQTLTAKLQRRNPLTERVHLTRPGFAAVAVLGVAGEMARRVLRPASGQAAGVEKI